MKSLSKILICVLVVLGSVHAQSFHPVPKISDASLWRQGTARTAQLLSASAKSGTPIRVLIYGQSISVQDWWLDVKAYLTNKYPNHQLTIVNKAVGGFSSERLKIMVANDVGSFYPDLILFHDYGNEADYETIIKTIRSNTTAEIAIQTDHMAVQSQEWHDRHSAVWLPALCKQYGLALVDVRSAWKEYLKQHNLTIQDLLSDGVHLNAHGNYLMAGIVKQYFDSLSVASNPTSPAVQHLMAGSDFVIKGKSLTLPVHGNRVELVWKANANPANPLRISIDGESPKKWRGCYYYTRPTLDSTSFFLKRIGQLIAMDLTDKVTEESWMMTITAVDSVQQRIHFSLRGSKTGADGEGTSDSTFVSRSGKISIAPQYWFRAKEFAHFLWLKPGEVLRWDVRSMCHNEVVPEPSARVTIVQGVQNRMHRLKLSGKSLQDVAGIIIYRPPLAQ